MTLTLFFILTLFFVRLYVCMYVRMYVSKYVSSCFSLYLGLPSLFLWCSFVTTFDKIYYGAIIVYLMFLIHKHTHTHIHTNKHINIFRRPIYNWNLAFRYVFIFCKEKNTFILKIIFIFLFCCFVFVDTEAHKN